MEPTLTTTAVGRTKADPDQVELQFRARAVEPNVTAARRAVAERATRLRESLASAGVSADRVRTSQFRIRQRPPDGRGQPSQDQSGETPPYEATETVGVTLPDPERLGGVLTAAADEAAVEIDDVGFTFRAETRRELQREAIADGVAAARQKATAAAEAEDLSVASVESIVTDEGTVPRPQTAGGQLAMDTSEPESVESGPIEVSVGVEVTYRLQNAES
jgi:uncharacterized protein YggE